MSWSLPASTEFLPVVSAVVLEKRVKYEDEVKSRLRFLAALRRKKGWSLDEIAESLQLPRMTVHGILWRFVNRGLDAAYDSPRGGRPRYLNVKQRDDLRKRLIAGPQANGFREGSWSTRMVLHLVEDNYGKRYTREHMTRVLRKMGFSPQKPRPANARKATEEEVRAFKKKSGGWYPTTRKKVMYSSAGTKSHSA